MIACYISSRARRCAAVTTRHGGGWRDADAALETLTGGALGGDGLFAAQQKSKANATTNMRISNGP
jgi:hypothetical protein